MASSLTDTLENRMLDWSNPAVALPTRPTSPLKVALYTVMPNPETGTGGTEVIGFAYARATITFPLASSGATSNTSAVTSATATGGNWGDLAGIAILDSAGVPVMMWSGTFNSPRTINDGQTFQIPAGALTLPRPAASKTLRTSRLSRA
jgi:hypothetical protein